MYTGIFLSTLDGVILDCNESFARIFGYGSKEEVLTHGAPDFYFDPAQRESYLEQIQKERNITTREVCMRGKDERPVWVLESISLVNANNGAQPLFQGTIIEITLRKIAEAELKKQKELMQAVFDNAPFMISCFSKDDHIETINRAWERTLGWSLDEIKEQAIDVLSTSFPDPLDRQQVRDFMTEATSQWKEFKTIARDGRVLDTTWAVASLSDGTRVCIGEDRTRRNQAEDALRESEEKYRALFQMAPDGVAVFDPRMTVVMVNHRAADIYGYASPAEMIGVNAFDIIAPQLRPRATQNARRIFEEGYLPPLESIGLKKDGTQIAIETSAALIRNADGQPLSVLGVTRDITDRRRAEAEISQLLAREQAAREEAEVTRDANVALTQNLSLEKVLETLLVYLGKLVPFDSANVMLRVGETKFVVSALSGYVDFRSEILARATSLDVNENDLLRQIVTTQKSVLIADTQREPAWQTLPGAEHVRCWLGVPLTAYGKVTGIYSVDTAKPGVFTSEHIRRAETLAAQAASAIQNAQLFEQGQRYAAELEQRIAERECAEEELTISHRQLRALSARLQTAREEEGTRIAREIHDELGGALTGLKWDLEGLDKVLSGAGKSATVAAVRKKIPNMTDLIESTISTVRRISSELRPGLLDDLGLVSAIEWQTEQFQSRTGIECEFITGLASVDLSRDRTTAVFRIFQEVLTNVIRHAEATKVRIELQELDGYLELSVKDNGRGITEKEIANPRSLGLLGMRERALLLGGEVITSGAAGVGTTVIARVPVLA